MLSSFLFGTGIADLIRQNIPNTDIFHGFTNVFAFRFERGMNRINKTQRCSVKEIIRKPYQKRRRGGENA